MQQTRKTDGRYFTIEEQKETLRNVAYDKEARREQRPTFTFRSGATYEGEWRGGFRDGSGR